MKITVELPDDTISGFVNFVYGNMFGLTLGTLALDGDDFKNGEATYRSCLTKDEAAALEKKEDKGNDG